MKNICPWSDECGFESKSYSKTLHHMQEHYRQKIADTGAEIEQKLAHLSSDDASTQSLELSTKVVNYSV